MKNIAFYGGSFNPPNNIHLNIAKNILQKLDINELYFVPVGNYYEKNGLIDVNHRYNMLNLICQYKKNMHVSDITLNEVNNLKAIDIFKIIKNKYESDNIYFIMGADNFVQIHKWKDFEELVGNFKIIIVKRDDININNIILENKILEKNKDNFYIVDIDNVESQIDSTEIRSKIEKGENVQEYLNINVYNYIKSNNLYKTGF